MLSSTLHLSENPSSVVLQFVNSHILYGILACGSTNHLVLQPLQVLKNKIIKIICDISKSEHVKNNTLYHELKLLKVKDMYHLVVAKFMYLFHHNKLSNLCNQYFTFTKTVHKYNTRCTSYSNFYLHAINSMLPKKQCDLVVPKFGIVCNQIGKIFLFLNLKKQLKPI